MIKNEAVEKIALTLCMQGVGRYLECLNAVTYLYEGQLDADFLKEARDDFAEYARRMREANMNFVDLRLENK